MIIQSFPVLLLLLLWDGLFLQSVQSLITFNSSECFSQEKGHYHFIHTPKTGGTTLNQFLLPNFPRRSCIRENSTLRVSEISKRIHTLHSPSFTSCETPIKKLLQLDFPLENITFFGFVREPKDWAASAVSHLLQDPRVPHDPRVVVRKRSGFLSLPNFQLLHFQQFPFLSASLCLFPFDWYGELFSVLSSFLAQNGTSFSDHLRKGQFLPIVYDKISFEEELQSHYRQDSLFYNAVLSQNMTEVVALLESSPKKKEKGKKKKKKKRG